MRRSVPFGLVFGIIVISLPISAECAYTPSADSIHHHIAVLASDSLEGREVGEIGEMKAAKYVSGIFRACGLEPMGDNGGYLQSFEFTKRIELGPKNRLAINGVELIPGEDFEPLDQSADTSFTFDLIVDVGYGITTADSAHNDYANVDVSGKAVLVRRYAPEPDSSSTDPHAGMMHGDAKPDEPADSAAPATPRDTTFDRSSSITSKIITALENQASGIFFITPETHDDTIFSMGVTHVNPKDVPIIFLRRRGLEKLGLSLATPEIETLAGQTDLVRVRDTGYNVIGYLPGESKEMFIVGAHYDHLGWGTPASRYRGNEKKIHYGADDNGSGTAALLELARYYSDRRDEMNRSMLFIAFSGEESGLLGSSYFVRNWGTGRDDAYMMLNMDMVGRLSSQDKGLMVMGTGTATELKAFFDNYTDTVPKMTFTESGAGPSDHSAFYNDSIPVLHFFTGAHQDYHSPDDVVDKIDFDGVVSVANMVSSIVDEFDDHQGMLAFQRTKDVMDGRHRSAFSVTLGIMPDYMSEVEGLRIDGVSPDRPADKAGMLKGDVVIRLGELSIGDIYDYMNALSKFRKGDVIDALVVRDADTLSLTVEFK